MRKSNRSDVPPTQSLPQPHVHSYTTEPIWWVGKTPPRTETNAARVRKITRTAAEKQHPPTAAAMDPANLPHPEPTYGKRKQTGHPPTVHLPAPSNPITTSRTTPSKTDNENLLPDRADPTNPTPLSRKQLDEITWARQTRVPIKPTLRRRRQNESHPAHRPEKVGLLHTEARKAAEASCTNTSKKKGVDY